jgi:2',3'-cyclic-nucleotide 2'-phosphodiesterase (5'-nucleotidase family)
MACSPKVQQVASVSPDYYRIDNRQEANDNEISQMIVPYKAQLDATMNEVIGQAEKSMSKSKPNSPLNNWIADVLLDQAIDKVGNVDFAVQNYGGIRVPSIEAGDVTIGKIYELMPFDNMVTVIYADGKIVQQLLDRIAAYGGWPISKNVYFTIENEKAVDVMINGKPLMPSGKYVFALPDYVANGGDDCFFLSDQERKDLDLLIRDAIINHIKKSNGKIIYNDEIRIQTR